jgi:hypothetical protein
LAAGIVGELPGEERWVVLEPRYCALEVVLVGREDLVVGIEFVMVTTRLDLLDIGIHATVLVGEVAGGSVSVVGRRRGPVVGQREDDLDIVLPSGVKDDLQTSYAVLTACGDAIDPDVGVVAKRRWFIDDLPEREYANDLDAVRRKCTKGFIDVRIFVEQEQPVGIGSLELEVGAVDLELAIFGVDKAGGDIIPSSMACRRGGTSEHAGQA